MASTRPQVGLPPNGVGYPDVAPVGGGKPTAFFTTARHTLFGNLYLATGGTAAHLCGGMQAFSVEERNNTAWRAQSGSDWLEPVFGMREWSGQGSRFMIRGNDIVELIAQKYGSVNDIDFRFLPFIWMYQYNQQSASGSTTVEQANWTYMGVIITRYRWSYTDPMTLLSEDFDFIGRGYSRNDQGQSTFQNLHALWGTPGSN